ncbi:3-hydroxyacyl-ACP dehydratase FabZ family protein [Haloglycomyces albus]|uniref:3-hydroxyacyl-ACP dehydratase FabZ family protein n=1 Tax=Haloglycomyces albus TaxID=526067 RepID=UPI0004A46663|nr:beta-hydroxyacyl-ACP dehydratase [Haloglycomyces albus]
MQHTDIKEILPHRYPMLLVDRILDLKPGTSLRAAKAVSGNEPWYAHSDSDAYPTVLLVESWCQAAGVLVAADKPNPSVVEGKVMLFGGMSDVDVHRPVFPGDTLIHHVELQRDLGDTVLCGGHTTVDDQTVLSVDRIVMAMRPAQELTGGTDSQ